MKEKTKDNYDFSDFLLDDEFVRKVKDESCSVDYISELKARFPAQEKDIDQAIQVLEVMENEHVFSTQGQRQKVWFGVLSAFSTKKSVSKEIHSDWLGRERRIIRNIFRVAASIVLLVGLGTIGFYYHKNKEAKESSIDRFASTIKVDYKKTELILSDGKTIEVSSGDSRISYSADGKSVNINDTSNVVQPVKDMQFNQMIVPFGKYASLVLSDGTKVWLNSGSRMVYPPVFAGKQREVYLQGEGYFEVSKNAQIPFYVKTDRFKVKVLGTKFDVQAYAKDNIYSALLLEGKVSLSTGQKHNLIREDVTLAHSERGAFSESSNNFVVEKMAHPENFIAWTHGYINFEEEALESLLKRISVYYNIDIHIRSVRGSFKISGKLDLKEDPERVLKGLAIISKMNISKQEGGGYLIND